MAITFNELVVLDFTEKEVNDRGTSTTWGANYVFSSGGLQNDITLIAHKFDYGYVPAASGTADLGASGTPFRSVYANQAVFGDADASGGFYMFGNQFVGEKLIYRVSIDSGALRVDRVPAVGEVEPL